MFIALSTTRGEKISINVNKVLFFAQAKRGSSVILEDGTLIELNETYDDLLLRFSRFK